MDSRIGVVEKEIGDPRRPHHRNGLDNPYSSQPT
jgi:hypothetical protein